VLTDDSLCYDMSHCMLSRWLFGHMCVKKVIENEVKKQAECLDDITAFVYVYSKILTCFLRTLFKNQMSQF
jgi:hypothetical protein